MPAAFDARAKRQPAGSNPNEPTQNSLQSRYSLQLAVGGIFAGDSGCFHLISYIIPPYGIPYDISQVYGVPPKDHER